MFFFFIIYFHLIFTKDIIFIFSSLSSFRFFHILFIYLFIYFLQFTFAIRERERTILPLFSSPPYITLTCLSPFFSSLSLFLFLIVYASVHIHPPCLLFFPLFPSFFISYFSSLSFYLLSIFVLLSFLPCFLIPLFILYLSLFSSLSPCLLPLVSFCFSSSTVHHPLSLFSSPLSLSLPIFLCTPLWLLLPFPLSLLSPTSFSLSLPASPSSRVSGSE